MSEIDNCLKFVKHVYGVFDFKFELELSTRPEEKYLGDIAVWDKAEEQLKGALDKFCSEWNDEKKLQDSDEHFMKWKLNAGDGAFYGPKIDIKLFDSLKREHQCGTIQLDFQLPLRFGLSYSTATDGSKKSDVAKKDDKKFVADEQLHHLQQKYLHIHSNTKGTNETTVIIHRAIYGSFELFIAVLTEHLLGKWPFWLSPRQIKVIPVTNQYNDYADKLGKIFHEKGYWTDVDLSRDRLNKKIRNAQTSQYNFILVVGEKEEQNETVNIRTRDNKEHGEKSIDETLKWFDDLIQKHE